MSSGECRIQGGNTMEMERDFAVHYSTDIEHKSLYERCLRQTQEDGTQIGGDLIPWHWSLQFEAAEVFHHFDYSRDWRGLDDRDEDQKDDAANEDTIETIQAKLIPVERLSFPPRYYMFGYRDAVEMISLKVIRSSNDTYCTTFSFAKYRSEIDFHQEDVPHHLGFNLRLSEDKFDKILQLMRLNTLDRLSLSVGKVDGFYSNWSPEITSNSIHILVRSCLEDLNLKEHADHLPTIGKVRDFQISAREKSLSITRKRRMIYE